MNLRRSDPVGLPVLKRSQDVATVSILLPSLNAREFLEPRVRSLLQQTFTDWEAIVLDSQSDDGTWEYFRSVARTDPRFRLHQIPREGLYAALNRGLDLAGGEFLHIATCDDSMTPDFLAQMQAAFAQCPEAGIAACDVRLISRKGDELSRADLAPHLTKRAVKNLLSLDRVRTAFADERPQNLNYRPVPHDCLLHFDGRSVYFSLNQLLIRTRLARGARSFKTTIGSVADFDWLLRLTSSTGTVHVPEKLAMWRFHGNQLSLQPDESRAASREVAAKAALADLEKKHPGLLNANDQAALLLSLKLESAGEIFRIFGWFESAIRLGRMLLVRPSATWRALSRERLRFGTRRHTLVPMIFHAIGLEPRMSLELRGKKTELASTAQ